MSLRRDRYESDALLSQLAKQLPAKDGRKWCFRFKCNDASRDVVDFPAYLPDETNLHDFYRTRLAQFFEHLSSLDNLVQESCEAEFKSSQSDLVNFKFHIGWIE